MTHKSPVVAADIIIQYSDGDLVFVIRKYDPYKGKYAIPGGGVEIGETVEQAAIREAKEETGLDVELLNLVGVYSDPNRDPRGHCISIAFHANPIGGKLEAASDAAEVIKTSKYLEMDLAFDHNKIIADFIRFRKP